MSFRNLVLVGPVLLVATCGYGETVPVRASLAVPPARSSVPWAASTAASSAAPLTHMVVSIQAPSASDTACVADVGPRSQAASSTLAFPIDYPRAGLSLSHFDAATSTATFGAHRGGARVHAGCDLYLKDDAGYAYKDSYYKHNRGSTVYAIADGVILEYAPFYAGTHAVVVDHGERIVRYGEVSGKGLSHGLKVGSKVRRGEPLAQMGDLQMGASLWAMLHFEVYSKSRSGPLSDGSNRAYLHVPKGAYMRRGDLVDCRPIVRAILNSRAEDRAASSTASGAPLRERDAGGPIH